jgi:hypothetical protein
VSDDDYRYIFIKQVVSCFCRLIETFQFDRVKDFLFAR